jgi:hypothetical protein
VIRFMSYPPRSPSLTGAPSLVCIEAYERMENDRTTIRESNRF